MKIRSLTIRNFKSFGSHQNIEEDEIRQLSQFNMLYGYNNSGKSNILKFLTLIFKPKSSIERIKVDGEDIQRSAAAPFWTGLIDDSGFLFHKNDRSKPIEFRFIIEVMHDELKNKLQNFTVIKKDFLSTTHNYSIFDISGKIKAVDDFHTSEMGLDEVKLDSRKIYSTDASGNVSYFEGAKDKQTALINDSVAFESLLSIFENLICFLDNSRFFDTETISHKRTELSSSGYKNWLYNLYLDPEGYKTFAELIDFIKKHKVATKNGDEDGFKGVEKNSPFTEFNPEFSKLTNDKLEIMLKAAKDRFPLTSFGTGIQQLLFILSRVFITNSKILLIEELEMNFSPKYQKELLVILRELINSGKVHQVFFTTHSDHFSSRTDFSIYEVTMSSGISTIKKVRSKSKVFFKPS